MTGKIRSDQMDEIVPMTRSRGELVNITYRTEEGRRGVIGGSSDRMTGERSEE